jgi:Sec-independent protein translocase protein TatA
MFGLGAQELMLILVIVLVLFGGAKIRSWAARSVRRFASSSGASKPPIPRRRRPRIPP